MVLPTPLYQKKSRQQQTKSYPIRRAHGKTVDRGSRDGLHGAREIANTHVLRVRARVPVDVTSAYRLATKSIYPLCYFICYATQCFCMVS